MTRHIYLYWLLLLIPTLAVGAAAAWVLRREAERAERDRRRAAEELAQAQAQLFGQQLDRRLRGVQQELMTALKQLEPETLQADLARWDRQEPLVRNVFVWDPHQGLLLPDPAQPENREQLGFIMRYDALFSGRMPWSDTIMPVASDAAGANRVAAPAALLPPAYAPAAPRQQRARQQMKAAPSSQQQTSVQRALTYNRPPPDWRTHWLAWFADRRVYFLGWARRHHGGRVRGVELETMALLSRLHTPAGAAAETAPAGRRLVCRLLDGSGRVMLQHGDVSAADEPPVARAAVPMGASMPHWQCECLLFDTGAANAGYGRYAVLLGWILAAILVVAILSGGSLLLWQARRHALDATRKTSFVSNVSHELKTPLTSIRMYAELLAENRASDPDKQQKYLGVIAAETQRLGRLVNNVLDFSRLEQGRKKYNCRALDAGALLRDVALSHEPRLRAAGLEPALELPEADVTVHADRDAVEQILVNLVDNACKYAADGGALTLKLAHEDGMAAIGVLDRGDGIPADQRQRIFSRFHRVDDSLTQAQGGVGLGLSIAHRLAVDMNGDLRCTARAGGGVAFTLLLPIMEDPA